MELPLDVWKELVRFLNESDRANFVYCLLGEERPIILPNQWHILVEFLDMEVTVVDQRPQKLDPEDSFENQRKALRKAYKTYLNDKLGANVDNYMNDEHLFCFQCHEQLSISSISLDQNRTVLSRIEWAPDGLKKKVETFQNPYDFYGNFISEMIINPDIATGVKSVILSKECKKCNIMAHFERSSYCDHLYCRKEDLTTILCGCGRAYCLGCTWLGLTDRPQINGLCSKCNRFICDNCGEWCHFVDINCSKRFCHRCAEDCEFCGLEVSCNEHSDIGARRRDLCVAAEPKNLHWYGAHSVKSNNVEQ